MKKVSSKKYYEYFYDNVYCHEGISHSVEYPSKHEVIDKYYIHGLKVCYHTEKYWEDERGFHQHKEYFIAD